LFAFLSPEKPFIVLESTVPAKLQTNDDNLGHSQSFFPPEALFSETKATLVSSLRKSPSCCPQGMPLRLKSPLHLFSQEAKTARYKQAS
jgi:hypothetical protein